VRELDAISDVIAAKNAQLRELDALAQALFYDTFGDPITNPKGWPVKKLGEVAEPTTGITYSPADVVDEGIIVLRSGNIQEGEMAFDDIVRVNKQIAEKYFVQDGDILMCSRNGSFRLVGKTAMINNLCERMTWGAFMTIIRSEYNPYLLQYFRTPAFREQLTSAKTTTVNQITIGMLRNLIMPIPSIDIMQSFAAKIQAIEAQKATLRQSIAEFESLLAQRMDYHFN
jgi:type I restriction enzyme S subunit